MVSTIAVKYNRERCWQLDYSIVFMNAEHEEKVYVKMTPPGYEEFGGTIDRGRGARDHRIEHEGGRLFPNIVNKLGYGTRFDPIPVYIDNISTLDSETGQRGNNQHSLRQE